MHHMNHMAYGASQIVRWLSGLRGPQTTHTPRRPDHCGMTQSHFEPQSYVHEFLPDAFNIFNTHTASHFVEFVCKAPARHGGIRRSRGVRGCYPEGRDHPYSAWLSMPEPWSTKPCPRPCQCSTGHISTFLTCDTSSVRTTTSTCAQGHCWDSWINDRR
jgi:hypothetical protein